MTVSIDQFLSVFWQGGEGCFRQFHDTDKQAHGINYAGTWGQLQVGLLERASQGYGTFFIPNQGGHNDANITTFNAVYIDLDSGKGHSWPDNWHVTPSIITHRNGNYHAYWLLQPGAVTDADTFRIVQKRLIARYDSDKPIHNPARVMRLPGTPHHKSNHNAPGYEVNYFEPQLRYNLDQVTTGLPHVQHVTPGQTGPGRIIDDRLSIGYATQYLTDKAPIATEGEEGDHTTYQVACAVRDFGVSEDMANALMSTLWNVRCNPPWSDRDLSAKVQHAYRYAQNAAGNRMEALRTMVTDDAAAPALTPDRLISECADLGAQIINTAQAQLNELRGKLADQADDIEHAQIEVQYDAIYQMVKRSFWSASKQKMLTMTDNGDVNIYAEQDAFRLMQATYGHIWDCNPVIIELRLLAERLGSETSEVNRMRKMIEGLSERVIFDHLKRFRQAESSNLHVDLFSDERRIDVRDKTATVRMPFIPFVAASPVPSIDMSIIQDYKQHFPEFEELLEFIVAARVSPNRKKAYVWIKANSDWGKNFFANILDTMNAAVSVDMTEIRTMLSGSPVGKSAADFRRSLALIFDEIKSVNSEFKQLQDSLHLSPKNQLTIRVPIYAKIMLSAEDIPSLVSSDGSVEDQFANRISMMKFDNGSLEHRPKRQEVGVSVYQEHIRQYGCDYINRRIGEYQALGRLVAEKQADDMLTAFHSKYSLGKTYGVLSDSITDIGSEFVDWVVTQAADMTGDRSVRANYHADVDGVCYLASPAKVFESWIKEAVVTSEQKMISWKRDQVFKAVSVDGEGVKQRWYNKRNKKALAFKHPRVSLDGQSSQSSNVVQLTDRSK